MSTNGAPLSPGDARLRIQKIREVGTTLLSDHAVKELEADKMDMGDVANVLRGGVVQPAEWEGGEWRYRVITARMACVVSFESEDTMTIVSGWRLKNDRGKA